MGCGGAPTGEGPLVLTETVESVAVDARTAFLTVSTCTSLVAVRRADGCASSVPVRDADADPPHLHALDALGDQLLVAGDEGALFVLPIEGTP
jgi:hypothetical protein